MGVATAIGLGLAAAGSGLSAAMGGGGGGGQKLELPPELMLQYINQSQTSLTQINDNIGKIDTMTAVYNSQLDTISKAVNGMMPSEEAVKSLQQQTMDMAKKVGMTAQQLLDNGLMTPEAAKSMQGLEQERAKLETERQALAGKIGAESQDPALIRKQQEQRSQLQQDLMRQGIRGGELQQKLAQFDKLAREERYTQGINEFNQGSQIFGLGQQQLQAGSSLLGQRLGAEAQGFQAISGLSAQQQAAYELLYGQRGSGISALANIEGERFVAGRQAILDQSALQDQAQQIFQRLGNYNYRGDVKNALESGVSGPGTVQSQTGYTKEGLKAAAEVARKGYAVNQSSVSDQEDQYQKYAKMKRELFYS